LNLELNALSKTRAKRSSSETLLKRSAPDAEWNGLWIDNTDLFSELLEETLNRGHSIRFRAPGDSMYPTIRNGDVITVTPTETAFITIGDIILYRHKSGVTAHRVIRITKRDAHHSQHSALRPQTSDLRPQSYFILRGDAAVVFDDPVSADQILGKVTLVERSGRRINPYTRSAKILFSTRRLASRLRRFVFSQTNENPSQKSV
jgi:signal peptidase I